MKQILRWVGILLIASLLAVVALPFLIDTNQFRPKLEAELSKALAREVTVGDLKLAILSGGVTADEISVADDPAYSRGPFVHTRSLTLGVDIWPLIFSRQLRVTRLTLDQPQIELIQSAAGDWNFSSLAAGSKSSGAPAAPSGQKLDLSVKLVKITNGRLSFAQQNSHAKARVLESVNVEVDGFSAGSVFPFRLSGRIAGGGDLQLNGRAGPINLGSAAETPAKVTVKLSGFDLAAAGVENGTGLAGLLGINGIAAANGKTLFLNGTLTAEKLKLAKNGSPAREPVAFDFTLQHDMHRNAGVLRRGEVHIGSATASLTGTYAAHGESTSVQMNFAGTRMPVPQLAAMLPAFGIVLPAGSSLEGGTAHADLSLAGPVEALVTDGSLGLDNTRLSGFDLGNKMASIEKLAGIKTGPNTEIQSLAATLHMAPEGSTVQDIKFVAPALGELSGAGTVSPAHALDFKMRASVHTGNAVMTMIGAKSDAGVPFTIEGTAENPIFRPDVKGMVEGRLQSIGKGFLGRKH